MKQTITLFLAALFAMSAWAGGDDSDGHTHAAKAPAVTTAIAPRAVAATEDFEIVAVLEGKKLVVYVDRFGTNEPVSNAKVELEGAGLKGLAVEIAPGTYVMDVAAAIPPASHPLTISIEAGDITDLLTATLEISPPAPSIEPVGGWRQWIIWIAWIVGGVLLLASGALFVARRNRKRSFSER